MNNNPSSENNPKPDPKKDDAADANDLSKANLPKGGNEMPDQLESTHAASGTPSQLDNAAGELRDLLPTLRAVCDRQRQAADAGAKRPDFTEDELRSLFRVTQILREQGDMGQAPPVDHDLVRMATWNQLPTDLAIEVQRLRIKWSSWNIALLAAEAEAIAIQDAAEMN